jgi:hypothetical protein
MEVAASARFRLVDADGTEGGMHVTDIVFVETFSHVSRDWKGHYPTAIGDDERHEPESF